MNFCLAGLILNEFCLLIVCLSGYANPNVDMAFDYSLLTIAIVCILALIDIPDIPHRKVSKLLFYLFSLFISFQIKSQIWKLKLNSELNDQSNQVQ